MKPTGSAATRPAPAPRSQPEQSYLRELVPLRVQGPVELVDRASQILRNRGRDLLFVSLAINVPLWLFLALILRDKWATGLTGNAQWFWSSVLPEPFLFGTSATGADGSTAGWLLGRALPSIGLAATGAVLGVMIGAWSKGRQMHGGEALRTVARRGHKLLGLWAVVHLIELVTCVGLVLGPLVFAVTAPLWAMEDLTVRAAIRRSWQLCSKQIGRVLATVALATAVSVLIGSLLAGGPLLLLYGLAGNWIDLGGTATVSLAGVLPHAVIDPLLGVAMSLLALDLKVRVDAADLLSDLATLRRPQA